MNLKPGKIKHFFGRENHPNFHLKGCILALLLILIAASGCSLTGKSGASASSSKSKKAVEDIRVGTQGIVISFLPNNPPERMVVEDSDSADNSIKIVLQVNNKGAYPQPGEGTKKGTAPEPAKIYISGYDQNIITFPQKEIDLSAKALEGKSTINPNGGIDFVDFKGTIHADVLNVEKYEPTLLATACYYYNTVASPQVCIDTDPYSEVSTKKVCQVSDISLSNQGAPVAVTKVAEEALATKTQFRITVKNVGGGDVVKTYSEQKCNPLGTDKLQREDIDKVYLVGVDLGNKQLNCGPFSEGTIKSGSGFIRLINGEGNIICEFLRQDYPQGANTAYTTPLKIQLGYNYRTTVERKVLIKKETITPIGGSTSSSSSSSSSPPLTAIAQSGGSDAESDRFFT
jgi:hypothetical protein